MIDVKMLCNVLLVSSRMGRCILPNLLCHLRCELWTTDRCPLSRSLAIHLICKIAQFIDPVLVGQFAEAVADFSP